MRMRIRVLAVLTIVVGFSGNTMASGFALVEQSVSGLGNAFAGGAAAEDASTVFYNPAGMTRIKEKQAVAGFHLIIPKAEFSDNGSPAVSSVAVPGIPPIPNLGNVLVGGNGGDAGSAFPVPNLYYVETFDIGWSFGLGINVPFGLSTEYDSRWVGRYYGVKSEIQTININPSAAHELDDNFSYGFGVSIQYLDAELSNAVDFGTLDTLGLFDSNLSDGTMDPVFGLTPQSDDGFTKASGDSWGFGFNLGVLYEFDNSRRLGLAYRSRISHDIEGDVRWTLPTTNGFNLAMAGATPNGLFQNGGAKVDIDLPSSASLSYYHDVNDRLAIMADITWTEWSVLDRLVLNYADDTNSGVTTFAWDDTFRYSLGATYQYNDTCKLRGGLAYDETPIPNEVLREVRVPGEDRFWITIGSNLRFSDTLSLDAAYAYITTPDNPEINKTTLTPSSEVVTRGLLKGEYEATVNIVSFQLNYNF